VRVERATHGFWDDISDCFEDLTIEAGLPPIRLHDLRLGAALLMLAAGVQETLGHANIGLTANTHTSIFPDLGRRTQRRRPPLSCRAHDVTRDPHPQAVAQHIRRATAHVRKGGSRTGAIDKSAQRRTQSRPLPWGTL
jgi:hypothetical protein